VDSHRIFLSRDQDDNFIWKVNFSDGYAIIANEKILESLLQELGLSAWMDNNLDISLRNDRHD